jgi:hypothetical protein
MRSPPARFYVLRRSDAQEAYALSRLRILFLLAALLTLAATLAACGGGGGSDNPQEVVDEATLQGIESGELDLSLQTDISGQKPGHLDVSVSGPFQDNEEAETPELALAVTADGSVGGEKVDRELGLTLLPNKAYVGYEGTEYEVDPTTFNFVKSMIKQRMGGKGGEAEATACREAVSKLRVADYIENLSGGESADVGGTETTKVSGDLDAPGAIEALIEIVENPACSEQLKATGQLPSIEELEEAKSTVQEDVKAAHVDLYVGDDHIIRRLVLEATIEPQGDSAKGAKKVALDLDLKLTGVNEDQTISEPSSAQPLSHLFVKLGINPLELLGTFSGKGGPPGLGDLLKGIGGSTSGGDSGGGQESYYECLQGAKTPVDLQHCTGLLQ